MGLSFRFGTGCSNVFNGGEQMDLEFLQVLGLLVAGVAREANVSSLLTDIERCALHKSPRLKRGNLFAEGCDPCRRLKGFWWLS